MQSADPTHTRRIVADHQFIQATRDAGYRGTAAAVAELIDNGIQARAREIHVLLNEHGDRRAGRWERDIELAVLDDGEGMDRETLWSALQFGGSSRFADRTGIGRFGMGLPNSSVSQGRRLEVYSWRSTDHCLFTYLDVDDIAAGKLQSIPIPDARDIPIFARRHAADHGTLVVWKRCDRLDYRKARTLREKLHQPLGRIYRRALWKGLRLTIDGTAVEPVDPIFVHPDSLLGSAAPYGNELLYEFSGQGGNQSVVRVRFSLLPVCSWSPLSTLEKRRMGIVGGGGVSFLRAGREIDFGWKLMGNKRRENYDDWWRCEVAFEADMDEEFGVTHSKQGINPSPLLRTVLAPDLEAIGRTLNARVRHEFALLQAKAPTDAAVRASKADRQLPSPRRVSNLKGSTGLTYKILVEPLESPSFFHVGQVGDELLVTLNEQHPFHREMYLGRSDGAPCDRRFDLEVLLLAAARAELHAASQEEAAVLQRHREAWSDALAAFLDAK